MGAQIGTEEKTSMYNFVPFKLQKINARNLITHGPKPRSGHRIVCSDSYLLSFGGFNPLLKRREKEGCDLVPQRDPKLFRELWCFNYSNCLWKKWSSFHSSLPYELASNAVILVGNTLFVHGGTGIPFGFTCSSKTFVTNIKKDSELKLIATGDTCPPSRYGQALVAAGKYLYSVGGTSGFHYTMDIYKLNLENNKWENEYESNGGIRDEPEGRYRHEIVLFENEIVVFGGGTVDTVFGFEVLPSYDLNEHSWKNKTTVSDVNHGFPEPRRCHGLVELPGDNTEDPLVIICGGTGIGVIYNDVWKFNLKTLCWTKLNTCLPIPMFFHSASVTSYGKMYIFGGLTEEYDESVTNVIESKRYNDIYSMWIKLPKLSEISWEALLNYARSKLIHISKENLIDIGIPLSFVNRL